MPKIEPDPIPPQPPKGFHPKTQALLNKAKGKKEVCQACGGTGISSSGRECYPCRIGR